jgi:DNA-binding FadR family transcriptional regulator
VSEPLPAGAVKRPAPEDATSLALASLAGRPARLSVVVVDVLVDRVVSGEYPAGTLIPPEPVLCQSFDVSRSVIREALKVLEQKGLVSVRQGQGTVVADGGEWNLLDPVVLAATMRHDERREVIDDLITVRAVLEAEMAARATTLVTDQGVEQLRGLVAELERSVGDRPRYLELDTQFHDELMRISGNRLGRAVVRSIHDQARSSAGYNDAQPEDLRLAHRGHVSILAHLIARDPERAAEAMREHVISMWQRKRQHSAGLDSSAPART